MFIKKLDFTVNLPQIKLDLDEILSKTSWEPINQIGLTHRKDIKNDAWKDCTGSLYNETKTIKLIDEQEFTEINEETPEYLKQVLVNFSKSQNFKLGRARFIRLIPNTGLSLHVDETVRYHLIVQTNTAAFVGKGNLETATAICYHLPANGHFYQIDTRYPHFVYNAGFTDRVHLVLCPN
jgi:hypothetical protein